MKVDFVAPGDLNCLNMDYRFFSEEFPEYVNSGFNDAFIAELDTTTWSLVPDPSTGTDDDHGAGTTSRPATATASRSSTVGPTIVTADNAVGTTYDAGTGTLVAKTPVTPGPHSIYLSVFDSGDSIYDSAVFADNLRFTSETAKQWPADRPVRGSDRDRSGQQGLVQWRHGVGDPGVHVAAGRNRLHASASSRLSSHRWWERQARCQEGTEGRQGQVLDPPASSGQGKLKLTKKGKRFFKENSKAKGKLKVKNTVNGTSSNSKVKIKG